MENKEFNLEELNWNNISTWVGVLLLSGSIGLLLAPFFVGIPILLIVPVSILAIIYLSIKKSILWIKAHFEYNKETKKVMFHELSYICERCGEITFIEPDIACLKCGFMKGGEKN